MNATLSKVTVVRELAFSAERDLTDDINKLTGLCEFSVRPSGKAFEHETYLDSQCSQLLKTGATLKVVIRLSHEAHYSHTHVVFKTLTSDRSPRERLMIHDMLPNLEDADPLYILGQLARNSQAFGRALADHHLTVDTLRVAHQHVRTVSSWYLHREPDDQRAVLVASEVDGQHEVELTGRAKHIRPESLKDLGQCLEYSFELSPLVVPRYQRVVKSTQPVVTTLELAATMVYRLVRYHKLVNGPIVRVVVSGRRVKRTSDVADLMAAAFPEASVALMDGPRPCRMTDASSMGVLVGHEVEYYNANLNIFDDVGICGRRMGRLFAALFGRGNEADVDLGQALARFLDQIDILDEAETRAQDQRQQATLVVEHPLQHHVEERNDGFTVRCVHHRDGRLRVKTEGSRLYAKIHSPRTHPRDVSTEDLPYLGSFAKIPVTQEQAQRLRALCVCAG